MIRFTEATRTKGRAPSHSPPDVRFTPGIKMARGLGWASLAIGAAELLAPRAVSRATGVRNEGLIQLYGLREIITGIGILTSARPATWLWARVVGDGVDLATLGTAAAQGDCQSARAALMSAAAVAGITAADLLTATELSAAEQLEG